MRHQKFAKHYKKLLLIYQKMLRYQKYKKSRYTSYYQKLLKRYQKLVLFHEKRIHFYTTLLHIRSRTKDKRLFNRKSFLKQQIKGGFLFPKRHYRIHLDKKFSYTKRGMVIYLQSSEIVGGVTKRELQTTYLRYLSQLKFCYERSLRYYPHLEGYLLIWLSIRADGQVMNFKIAKNTMTHKLLGDCLKKYIRYWHFPSSFEKLYSEVKYLIKFKSYEIKK